MFCRMPVQWGNGNVINGRARARVGANHWLLEGSRFARVRSQRRKPHDRDQMASVHDLCLARDQRPAQADCLFEAAICDPVPENVGGRENGTIESDSHVSHVPPHWPTATSNSVSDAHRKTNKQKPNTRTRKCTCAWGTTHTGSLVHERATHMTPHPHAIARVHAHARGSPRTAHGPADGELGMGGSAWGWGKEGTVRA